MGDYNFDGGSNTVKVIGTSGGAATTWNTGGSLNGASFVAFEGSELLVSSYYNSLINRFDGTTGAFLGSFAGPGGAQGIAVQTPFLDPSTTPEPGALTLLGSLVLLGAGIVKRRKK